MCFSPGVSEGLITGETLGRIFFHETADEILCWKKKKNIKKTRKLQLLYTHKHLTNFKKHFETILGVSGCISFDISISLNCLCKCPHACSAFLLAKSLICTSAQRCFMLTETMLMSLVLQLFFINRSIEQINVHSSTFLSLRAGTAARVSKQGVCQPPSTAGNSLNMDKYLTQLPFKKFELSL